MHQRLVLPSFGSWTCSTGEGYVRPHVELAVRCAARRLLSSREAEIETVTIKLLPACPLIFLAGCAGSQLDPLVLDGHELHASLVTRPLDDASKRHVPRAVLRDNPYASTDAEFVEAIARSASQGQISGAGLRAALFGLYLGESELGLYGLEAASTADAIRLEGVLREIWAHNARLGRARVHRGGKVLVVVWNDGVSSSCWEAANDSVVERLGAPLAGREVDGP